MKIIFDTEEHMNRCLMGGYGMPCAGDFFSISDAKCDSYNGNCKKCILDHIDVTYVKNCTECAKTGSCKSYYRGDLVNKLIKCEPRAK